MDGYATTISVATALTTVNIACRVSSIGWKPTLTVKASTATEELGRELIKVEAIAVRWLTLAAESLGPKQTV